MNTPDEKSLTADEKKSSDGRARGWTWIVYPESAPEDWRELLQAQAFPFAVSPLHDKDLNADGSFKKPHWHVVAYFSGKKSRKQVQELTDLTHSPGAQSVQDLRGIVRYLAHMDNPEKAQYPVDEIQAFGGFEVMKYILSGATKTATLNEIIDWIIANDVTEYADVVEYARVFKPQTWGALIFEGYTILLNSYCTSRRHRKRHASQPLIEQIAEENSGELPEA